MADDWKQHSRHKCVRRDEPCDAEYLMHHTANGGRVARSWCERCNCTPPTSVMRLFTPLSKLPPGEVTRMRAWDDVVPNALDDQKECAHCGKFGPVECHHWAPRHLFADADQWPQSYLCGPCHKLWHATMTPRMSSAAGVMQERGTLSKPKIITKER